MQNKPMRLFVIAFILCLMLVMPVGLCFPVESAGSEGTGATVDSPEPQQINPIYEGSREAGLIIDIAMQAAKDYMVKAFTENITEHGHRRDSQGHSGERCRPLC